MSKGTIYLFFVLTAIAMLLVGINIGKKINFTGISSIPVTINPTTTVSVSPVPTIISSQESCSSAGQSCGIGLTGRSLGSCCPGLTCKESGKPDMGGVCYEGQKVSAGTSTYTDGSCGYTFSIPGSYINSKSENGKSTIITDPDNPQAVIAAACATSLPRPPLSADKIEAFTIDNVSAIMYHDKTPEGNPRDEVIVKHPTKNLEIIIAGYGITYEQVLSSFKFIR